MPANLYSKCRTCLDDSNDCYQMIDYVEERYKIVEMLDCIVPQIDIKATQFSNLLCRNCVNRLLASFKFQQLCIESNNQLCDLLEIALKVKNEIKDESAEYEISSDETFKEIKSENINSWRSEEECDGNDSDTRNIKILANLYSKCRTCLNDSNDCYQMLDYVEEHYKIVEMLDCIVPQIDIKTIQFSNLLCRNCVNKLLASFKFQQLCIETNNRLHDLLGIPLFETEPEQILNPLVGTLIVKIEQVVEQYDSDNDGSGSNDTNLSGCIRRKKNTVCYKKKHDYPREICNTNITTEKTVKAHMLTHTNGEVSITKITLQNDCNEVLEDQEFLDVPRVNFSEDKDGCNNNEGLKSTDNFQETSNEAKEKVTRIIVKEELEIPLQTFEEFIDLNENTELVNKDYEDSRNNLEKKLLSNLGAKDTKSIEFVNTAIGEVEKNINNVKYLCETCGKAFHHPCYLKRHSSVVHSSMRPYECIICKYRFFTTTLLKGHMTKHQKCLENPKSLNYSCIVCQRNYKSIKSLAEHTVKKHPEIKKHACDQCGKIFNHTASLNKHMQVHNVNRYQCNQCGKNLSNSTNLRHHKERHADSKKYWCSECPSYYYIRSDLIRHEIIYHSNFENLEKPNKVNDTRLDVHRISDSGGEEVDCSNSKKQIRHQCPNCPQCLEKQASTSSHCKIRPRKDLFTNTK